MTPRNNVPIRYKGQTIWTNPQLLKVFTLLLIGEIKSSNPSYTLTLKSFYIDFDFESIFVEDTELVLVRESVGKINKDMDSKDYLISNNLGQRITLVLKSITPSISNKELSKEVTEVTSIRPETIKELFIQTERLLNEEEPYKTDERVSINYLLGKWKSKTVFAPLDFDVNFNMTDLLPTQNVILLISQVDSESYFVNISIPALNGVTNESVELMLVNGNLVLDKGILRITEFNSLKTYNIPIIRAESGLIETYLFKSRIVFENINAC